MIHFKFMNVALARKLKIWTYLSSVSFGCRNKEDVFKNESSNETKFLPLFLTNHLCIQFRLFTKQMQWTIPLGKQQKIRNTQNEGTDCKILSSN